MSWPTSTSGDADLYVAVNNLSTSLNGAIDAVVTSIVLTDATSFPATGGYATIGTEAIKYTGKSGNTLTGCTRGADGTTAVAHSNGAPVFMFFVADHHNRLKTELVAIETDLTTRIGNGSTSEVRVVAGSATVPAVSHSADLNTGLLWTGADVLQVTTAGSLSASFGADVTVNKGQLLAQNGTAALPGVSFSGDADTGMYHPAADTVGFAVQGTLQVSITTNGIDLGAALTGTPAVGTGTTQVTFGSVTTDIRLVNGGSEGLRVSRSNGPSQVSLTRDSQSESFCHLTFIGDNNTGLLSTAADTMAIVTNGVRRVHCDSSGRVGIGTSSPTSTAHVSGSLATNTLSTAVDITLDVGHYTVRVDASGANRTITLPAASGCTGRIYNIKKTDATANTVTIDANAAETIDGATTVVITTQYQSYTIQSNGTSWDVI